MNTINFKSYDKETIKYLNIIFNNNHPLNLLLNNKNYSFNFCIFSKNLRNPIIIRFSLNNEPVFLFIEDFIINHLITDFISDLSISNLDTKLKNIIISSVTEDLVYQIQKIFNNNFTINNLNIIEEIDEIQSPNMFFNIISEDNTKVYGGLLLNKISIKDIALLYKNRKSSINYNYDHLEFNILILLDIIKINYNDITNLEPNDIIILDNSEFINNKIYIKTPIKYFEAKINNNLFDIINIMEVNMANDKNASDDISEIPITLEFLIGHKTVTLGELNKISPGYTFELASNIEKPVTILANGKNIATGEIVRIEEKIGVRILELLGDAR